MVVLVLLVGLVLVVPVLVFVLVLVLVGGHAFIRIFKYAYASMHTCVIYKDISLVLGWSRVVFFVVPRWFQSGPKWFQGGSRVEGGSRGGPQFQGVPGGSR